jgi:hypothetical protein
LFVRLYIWFSKIENNHLRCSRVVRIVLTGSDGQANLRYETDGGRRCHIAGG